MRNLVDQGSREQGRTDQELRKTMTSEPSRSDRPSPGDAERRLIAEQDAVFPWSGWPSLRGPRAGTRIGEAPRERFRSRCRRLYQHGDQQLILDDDHTADSNAHDSPPRQRRD